jgi:hypothetical protein
MNIKAIETKYDGYRFRSRVEARWAVFFKAFGATYQYELEGFKLRNGEWYLPDFFVTGFAEEKRGFYFEVKPFVKPEQVWLDRLEYLSEMVDDTVFLLCGPPDFRAYQSYAPVDHSFEPEYCWYPVMFSRKGDVRDEYGSEYKGSVSHLLFTDRYRKAVNASRAARF